MIHNLSIDRVPMHTLESEILKLRSPTPRYEINDLSDLPFLNEAEILDNLHCRLSKSLIYSYAANIFIAMNPTNEVKPSAACDQLLKRFIDNIIEDFLPQNSNENNKESEKVAVQNIVKHSILVSGESGSGKTECAKLIIKSFLDRKADISQSYWVERIQAASDILDCFGNAKTIHTENSSRFGKLVELMYDQNRQCIDCAFRVYLLESSRTSSQLPNDRNFHIFYQLLAGASTEEKSRWNLLPADRYFYTNQGGTHLNNNDLRNDLKSSLPMSRN
jgi:myosin heavy subunit